VFDDIHRSHGQACAVHHAGHIAAEVYIIEAGLRCAAFLGVFLALIAEFFDIRMTEQSAVVEIQLGIEGNHVIFCRDHQRIDFGQRAVLADKSIVQAGHELRRLADSRLRNVDVIGHAGCLERCQTNHRVNVFLENLLRHFGSNLLNFHTAFFRAHHDHAGRLTVNDKGEIIFFLDIGTSFDKEASHLLAFRTSLMSDKRFTQQLACIAFHFIKILGQLDAASFAAATSMNLGFHHDHRSADFLGIFHSFFHREGRQSFGNCDPIGLQYSLALVLMNIHQTCLPEIGMTFQKEKSSSCCCL